MIKVPIYNVCNILSFCSTYGAFVDCLVKVYQGAGACFGIQIYDQHKQAADLSIFSDIQVLVKDVGGNVIAIPSDPVLIGSFLDLPLERSSTGIISFCLLPENTEVALTGKLMCDIKLSIDNSSGTPDTIFIPCLQIGVVYPSGFDQFSYSPTPTTATI